MDTEALLYSESLQYPTRQSWSWIMLMVGVWAAAPASDDPRLPFWSAVGVTRAKRRGTSGICCLIWASSLVCWEGGRGRRRRKRGGEEGEGGGEEGGD